MHDYRRLRAWEKARSLTRSVYEATKDYPDAEQFGMTSQMRRATVSIAVNIAEGAGMATAADFRRFIRYAIGSSMEVECLLELSADLGYLSPSRKAELVEDIGHVRAMLIRLERHLRNQ